MKKQLIDLLDNTEVGNFGFNKCTVAFGDRKLKESITIYNKIDDEQITLDVKELIKIVEYINKIRENNRK